MNNDPQPLDSQQPAGAPTHAHDGEQAFPKFSAFVKTALDTYTVATGDSVNGLEGAARMYLYMSPATSGLRDSQVASVTLQKQNPKTGALIWEKNVPANSLQDAITELHNLGAR